MEERDQILIERYLANELSAAERAEVEQRRQVDPVFMQELQEYEDAKEALLVRQREALKQTMRGYDKELDAKEQIPGKTKNLRWLWISVAALVLFSLLLWKVFFTTDHPAAREFVNGKDSLPAEIQKEIVDTSAGKKGYDPKKDPAQKEPARQKQPMAEAAVRKGEELYAENFRPYKDDRLDSTSRGSNDLTLLDQFKKYYWEGKYPEAVKAFSMLGAEHQSNDNLRFVYAIALAGYDKVEQAQLELKNIIDRKRSVYVPEANWYLGLLYLKQGDMVNARTYLKNCVDMPGGERKKEAEKLLEKIK